MNYIIDPSVFYWINVLSVMQTVSEICGAVSIASCLLCFGFFIAASLDVKKPDTPLDVEDSYTMSRYNEEYKEYINNLSIKNRFRFWTILLLIIGIILILLAIFLPSKQTSIEMLVAKTATYDNVNWSVQQVKEVIDYIVKALKTI